MGQIHAQIINNLAIKSCLKRKRKQARSATVFSTTFNSGLLHPILKLYCYGGVKYPVAERRIAKVAFLLLYKYQNCENQYNPKNSCHKRKKSKT